MRRGQGIRPGIRAGADVDGTVERANYEYGRTLNQILESNPLFTTTPANPAANISGGALGYFSAHAVQRRRLVVP